MAAASAGFRTPLRTQDGFEIPPGESPRVTLTADRRLLARFDGTAGQWRLNQGSYHVVVGKSASDPHLSADTKPAEGTLRHLTFASYRSPRVRDCALRDQMFPLPRAWVGAGARPSVVGAVVGLLAPVLIPSPRSPQPSSDPYGMNRRQHRSPFSCSRWCYRSPRKRSSCRLGASLSHSSCRAAHPLTCR